MTILLLTTSLTIYGIHCNLLYISRKVSFMEQDSGSWSFDEPPVKEDYNSNNSSSRSFEANSPPASPRSGTSSTPGSNPKTYQRETIPLYLSVCHLCYLLWHIWLYIYICYITELSSFYKLAPSDSSKSGGNKGKHSSTTTAAQGGVVGLSKRFSETRMSGVVVTTR